METERKFDVAICGTSLSNCVLAAALSRAGMSVLHLDANEFYGEEEGTHEPRFFVETLRKSAASSCGFVRVVHADEEQLVGKGFSVDATPKALLSCGPLVELLVRSEVSRYLEFKCLQSAFLKLEQGEPIKVPCSKSDVFQSSVISLVEKRFLMKFLGVIQEPELPADWKDKTFLQVLQDNKMEGLLQAVIVHAICGIESAEHLPAVEGAGLVKRYLGSVGRFGPSPFLFPLYGGSESSQAFSRLAAVNGGTYMLRKGFNSARRDEEGTGYVLVDSEGEEWGCKHIVLSPNSCQELNGREGPIIHRACAAVKQHPFGAASATFVVANGRMVHGLFLDSGMKVAPEGYSLVYLWSDSDVLSQVLEGMQVEWKIVWTTQARVGKPPLDSILVSRDPDQLELDFGKCINEAQTLFSKIAPEGAKFF